MKKIKRSTIKNPRGILSVSSGSQEELIVTKKNVIYLKTKKKKK